MINKAILQGRLTETPELMKTQSGKSVTSFTLAVDRRYKQDGGQNADFIRLVAWGKTAEFITAYFRKGQEIVAEGSIQVRSYTDKNGAKRFATEVIVHEVNFCGQKHEQQQNETKTTEHDGADTQYAVEYNDDELPF